MPKAVARAEPPARPKEGRASRNVCDDQRRGASQGWREAPELSASHNARGVQKQCASRRGSDAQHSRASHRLGETQKGGASHSPGEARARSASVLPSPCRRLVRKLLMRMILFAWVVVSHGALAGRAAAGLAFYADDQACMRAPGLPAAGPRGPWLLQGPSAARGAQVARATSRPMGPPGMATAVSVVSRPASDLRAVRRGDGPRSPSSPGASRWRPAAAGRRGTDCAVPPVSWFGNKGRERAAAALDGG